MVTSITIPITMTIALDASATRRRRLASRTREESSREEFDDME